MSTKKQQIQWIREEIKIAEAYAETDRERYGNGAHQDGKAAGLRKALELMGVKA